MCENCDATPGYRPPLAATEQVGSFNEGLRDKSLAVFRTETPYAVLAAAEVLARTPGTDAWYDAVEEMLRAFPAVPVDMPGPSYQAVATSLVLSHKIGQSYLN